MTLKELIDSITDPAFLDLVSAQDYPAIAAWLNEEPLVANPKPQQQVAAPLTMTQFADLLSDDEYAAAIQIGKFVDWSAAILTDTSTSLTSKANVRTANRAIAEINVSGQEDFLRVVTRLVEVGDRDALKAISRVMEDRGLLSSATRTTLETALDTTIPDPSYQAQIKGLSLAAQNGLGVITAEQVQTVDIDAA